MPTLAEVNVRIGADISQYQRGLRQAERELQRTAATLANLGNNLTTAVSLPLAAAGVAAFKFGGQLETAFLKIDNLTEISEADLTRLRETVSSLSGPLGKTQQELSEAAFFIEGAGLKGAAGLEALEQSAKASAVGLGEQTDVAKIAGAAVAAYGEQVLSAGASIDQLLQIAREGNAEPAELAASLGQVLPVAAQLGVSFAEVGANVASFTRLGVGASTAVDGLRSLLGNLLKPSEQATKELARFGLTAEDVRQSIQTNGLAATLQELLATFNGDTEGIARVFGDVQGLTAVLATAGAQGDAYAESLRKIQNASGEVDKAFEKTSQTAEFKLKQALVGLNSAATNVGATIVPVATDLLNAVLPLVQAFASLDDGTKKIIVSAGFAAAALGPLVKLAGAAVGTFATVSTAVKSFAGGISIAAKAFTNYQELAAAGVAGFGTLSNAVRAAGVAWKTFDLTVKATVIGGVGGDGKATI